MAERKRMTLTPYRALVVQERLEVLEDQSPSPLRPSLPPLCLAHLPHSRRSAHPSFTPPSLVPPQSQPQQLYQSSPRDHPHSRPLLAPPPSMAQPAPAV